MNEVPRDRLSEFAEAVALVGPDAALDLAEVELRHIRVATPKRFRGTVPATVSVVRDDTSANEYIDGIPAMPLRDALVRSKDRILPERLI